MTTRNLAIANRSHVSCAHNTSRASRPIVTLWPSNRGQGSSKVIANGTIRQIIYDLLLVELFDVEYYCDLEI